MRAHDQLRSALQRLEWSGEDPSRLGRLRRLERRIEALIQRHRAVPEPVRALMQEFGCTLPTSADTLLQILRDRSFHVTDEERQRVFPYYDAELGLESDEYDDLSYFIHHEGGGGERLVVYEPGCPYIDLDEGRFDTAEQRFLDLVNPGARLPLRALVEGCWSWGMRYCEGTRFYFRRPASSRAARFKQIRGLDIGRFILARALRVRIQLGDGRGRVWDSYYQDVSISRAVLDNRGDPNFLRGLPAELAEKLRVYEVFCIEDVMQPMDRHTLGFLLGDLATARRIERVTGAELRFAPDVKMEEAPQARPHLRRVH